jgi:threonine dehydrogenase-like Zn-dependent dehydrogenase
MLQVAQGARMRGAKRIIGVDLNPDKFDVGMFMIIKLEAVFEFSPVWNAKNLCCLIHTKI